MASPSRVACSALERHSTALFQPPSSRRFWMKTGPVWERTGRRVSALIAGGVILVEASKRVQMPGGNAVRDKVLNPLGALVPKPKVKPALRVGADCQATPRTPLSGPPERTGT